MLEAKSSLEILMEIESRFMNLTESIQYIAKNPPTNEEIIKKLEKTRKDKYREELQEFKAKQAIQKAERDK